MNIKLRDFLKLYISNPFVKITYIIKEDDNDDVENIEFEERSKVLISILKDEILESYVEHVMFKDAYIPYIICKPNYNKEECQNEH